MAATSEALQPRSSPATPWVLLLVEDDGKRGALVHAWQAAGFEVEAAATAREALECLKWTSPTLIVIEDRLYRPKSG